MVILLIFIITFFSDLVNDWSSKSRPDLLHFVPYTWMITLLMKEFELITSSNEYNWIDCSSQNQENAHIAFCGDLFDLSFDLPFCDFLPSTIPLRFWIQVHCIVSICFLYKNKSYLFFYFFVLFIFGGILVIKEGFKLI